MNSSKAIRKFERLLFKGIPEQPEHNYERDENANVSLRLTGRSQILTISNDCKRVEVLGVVNYDFEKQSESFVPNV